MFYGSAGLRFTIDDAQVPTPGFVVHHQHGEEGLINLVGLVCGTPPTGSPIVCRWKPFTNIGNNTREGTIYYQRLSYDMIFHRNNGQSAFTVKGSKSLAVKLQKTRKYSTY